MMSCRSHFVLRVSCLLAALSPCVVTAASSEIRTHRITRAASAPRIDGVLDDDCWKTALVLDDFRPLGGGQANADVPSTRAMLAYDADHLYVAYRCSEPPNSRLAVRTRTHDGRTWTDDCVEMFFNPSGDRRRYVQIVVNAAGVTADASFNGSPETMDLGYESGTEAATKAGNGAWTLEARIPFAGLPPTGPSSVWTFHLARTRPASGQHLTMLRSGASSFHDIDKFDALEGVSLPERPIGVSCASLGTMFRGRNIARATLENWGKQAVTVDVSAGLVGTGDRSRRSVRVEPGRTKTVAISWDLGPDAPGQRATLAMRLGKHVLHERSAVVGPFGKIIGRLRRNAYYIQWDAYVKITVPVRIAEGSRREVQLRWQATDADGRRVGSGQTVVRDPTAVIRLYWPPWQPGRYTIHLELTDGRRVLASAEQTILLAESPTGDD